jgi:hypothetical protein
MNDDLSADAHSLTIAVVNGTVTPRSTASVWIAPKQGSVSRSGPALSRRNGPVYLAA